MKRIQAALEEWFVALATSQLAQAVSIRNPARSTQACGGMIDLESDWEIVAEREAIGRVDTWDEYLCVCKGERHWLLGVCSYTLLGEIPSEWLDDEGQPKSAYADEEGYLLPPPTFDGRGVSGHNGEYVLGALAPINDYAVIRISDGGTSALAAALTAVGWDETDVTEVKQSLGARGLTA